MPKISREESAKIEARVLEAVEASEGPVTSQIIAKKLGLNWQSVKMTLLELAVLGKIKGWIEPTGWKFQKLPSQAVHSNGHVKIAVPSNGHAVKGKPADPESVMNARILDGLSRIYGDK